MAYIADHIEVRIKRKKKQSNEVKLSHKIYDTFNKEPWITNIRRTVKAGLGAMLRGNITYLKNAAKEEKFLQVWKNHGATLDNRGIQKLYNLCGSNPTFGPTGLRLIHSGRLNLSECADLIRLIGAWVEQHKGSRMEYEKKQERVGADSIDGPWTQPKDGMGRRNREDIHPDKNTWIDKSKNVTFDWTPLDIKRQLLLHGQDKHKDHLGVAGRELKRIPKNSDDDTLKIDQMFGLRDICSISGTTADVMYAINTFGRKSINGCADLGEIYRVFPFGSIAGFHHHSILEVALPQSLKGYIDYRIGFYTTLLSQRSKTSTSLYESINHILNQYEINMKKNNLHMICFYNGGFPEGAIVFNNNEEVNKFKNSNIIKVTKLSEIMPIITKGKLTFNQTMEVIRRIDNDLYFWLTRQLSNADWEKYIRVKKYGIVRKFGEGKMVGAS